MSHVAPQGGWNEKHVMIPQYTPSDRSINLPNNRFFIFCTKIALSEQLVHKI